MINEKNIIVEIRNRFPLFYIDSEFEDLLTYVGGNFADYLMDNIKTNNTKIINEGVSFINQLIDESEEAPSPFLDEIVLGLYDRSKEYCEVFKNRLSGNAIKYFDYGIDLWESQSDK